MILTNYTLIFTGTNYLLFTYHFGLKKKKKRVSEKGKINWQWNNEDDQLQKKNHDQRMNKIPNLWNFY